MRRTIVAAVTAMAIAAFALPAFATNGTNIIGVGTLSRSMGGVGVAAPQDAITAVFGNPAAMCYIPCETSEVDFAGTVFDPTVQAKVTLSNIQANSFGQGIPPGTVIGGVYEAKSQGAPFAFPAIGIYTPISDNWRFGLAAYGVSGLGVDYKDTDLALTAGAPTGAFIPFGPFDIKTELAVMKFAPNISYRILPSLSIGAAIQVNYAQLDLGYGGAHDFGFGTQVGIAYHPVDFLQFGLTYQSPQRHVFKRVFNFNADLNGDGLSTGPGEDMERDTLTLEQPQQVALGVAVSGFDDMLLLELDGKWLDWSDADGYQDFDWKDQWVIAVGVQVKPVDWLAIRMGYNWSESPVNEHENWSLMTLQEVQGNLTPTPLYEGFRVIGFPAIVENHITGGIGVNITPKVSLNLGYMHAFENNLSETSASPAPGVSGVRYESRLSEDSYEFGINIMF